MQGSQASQDSQARENLLLPEGDISRRGTLASNIRRNNNSSTADLLNHMDRELENVLSNLRASSIDSLLVQAEILKTKNKITELAYIERAFSNVSKNMNKRFVNLDSVLTSFIEYYETE